VTTRYATQALVGVLLLVLFFAGQGAAYAAPRQPTDPFTSCASGTFDQTDMAGSYESSAMLVEMTPCGAVAVSWMNAYGEHYAVYLSAERLVGGGVVAYGYMPDPKLGAYLDSAPLFAVKPAEKGWVQVASVTEDHEVQSVYRLKKTQ
jgi:hypothetical protein